MAKKKVEKPAAAPQGGMDDLDALMGGLGEQIQEASKDTGKHRTTVGAVGATQQLMVEYCGVDAAFKIADSRKKVVGAELKGKIWEELTNLWFSTKSQPSNPKVETKKGTRTDCSCIYQVRASFKLNIPEGGSGRAPAIQALNAAGFDDEMAGKIFDENIEIVIEMGLKPLNELAKGKWVSGDGGQEFVPATDVQKAAAAKILKFAQGLAAEALTAQERAEALQKETSYIVKAGFLDRAANYCDSADQLRALLAVIKPGEALSQIKFAAADSGEEKNSRIEAAFHGLLFAEDGKAIAAA